MSAKTQCPHCQKILKLKSEAAFGRTVPCPQCKTPFKVEPVKATTRPKKRSKPAAASAADEWEETGAAYDADDYEDYGYDDYEEYGYDEYEDYGDDDYGYDDYGEDDAYVSPSRGASSRRSKSKGSKSKKKKKKSAGVPPWVTYVAFGLIGVLLLGGVAGGIVMVAGSLGGENVIGLTWLPEDADMFIHVEPDELWGAPMLASVRESEFLKNVMAQAAQNENLDLGPADIDSITMAGVDMANLYEQRTKLFGGTVGAPTLKKKADGKMVGVMRLSRDVTEEEIAGQAGQQKQDYNGKSYFQAPGGQAMYLADARTMIVGEEDQVKKAIDRGPTEPRVRRLDFINPEHQLIVAIAPPKTLKPESAAQVPSTAPNAVGRRIESARKANSKWFGFGLSLKSDIEMEMQFMCFGSSEAEALKSELESLLADMKSKFESSTAQTPETMASFVGIGREAMDSLQTSRSGDEVTLSGRVPGRIVAAVQDAVQNNPMAQMMLQGMQQQMKGAAGNGPATGGGAAGMPAGRGAAPDAASLNPSGQPANPPAQAANPAPGNSGPGNPGSFPVPGGPTDAEAAVREDQKRTQETLDRIRGRVKSTTGSIQDAVPGGK